MTVDGRKFEFATDAIFEFFKNRFDVFVDLQVFCSKCERIKEGKRFPVSYCRVKDKPEVDVSSLETTNIAKTIKSDGQLQQISYRVLNGNIFFKYFGDRKLYKPSCV